MCGGMRSRMRAGATRSLVVSSMSSHSEVMPTASGAASAMRGRGVKPSE